MKTLIVVLVVLAVLLAVNYSAVRMNAALDLLTPDPENVVQGFVSTLSAGRYDIARDELDEELQAKMQKQNLEQLNHSLKERFGAYDFELGGEEQVRGDQAVYLARIKTQRSGTQEFRFELKRDEQSRLWEISNLNLEQAAS